MLDWVHFASNRFVSRLINEKEFALIFFISSRVMVNVCSLVVLAAAGCALAAASSDVSV